MMCPATEMTALDQRPSRRVGGRRRPGDWSAIAAPSSWASISSSSTCGGPRDGVTVIFHDDRTASGREVRALSHRELVDELGPEAMTFDELLDVAAGRVGLHLDLKETGYEAEIVHAALDSLPGRQAGDHFRRRSDPHDQRAVSRTSGRDSRSARRSIGSRRG